MRRKLRACRANASGDLDDGLCRNTRFRLGEFRSVVRVVFPQFLDEVLEDRLGIRVIGFQPVLPVGPLLEEGFVVNPLVKHHLGHGEQHRRLGSGTGGHPVVSSACGVGKPDVHDGDLRALVFRLHDALGVGIEVVPCLKVRTDEQDELRVRVIRSRAVGPVPDRIAEPRSGRADVGVAVVAIHAPSVQDTLNVALVSGAPDVVNHLVLAFLLNRLADFGGDFVQHLIPTDALPAALAAFTLAFKRVKDAVNVVDLVDRRWSLCAVAASASGMVGVAFKFADLARFLVHVRKQPTTRLTVEADGRHQRVAFGFASGPVLRLILGPVVPILVGREIREVWRSRFDRFQVMFGVLVRKLGNDPQIFGSGFDPRGLEGVGHDSTQGKQLRHLHPQADQVPKANQGKQRGSG